MDNNFNAEDNDNQKATYKDASNTYRGPEFKMPKFGIGQRIIAALVFTVALAVYIFFATPLLNIRFTSSLILMAIIICIYLAIINYKIILKLKYVIAFLFVIVIGANFISSPIFHSQKYYDLLGEVGMHDYSETMPNIDNTLIPVVDKALAKTLGDKVLGNDIGLGSQYTVGEYYFVSTKDDLAWVAPLEPLSFFKWLSNDGSPGYVYVSATNPNDVRLVQDINGEPLAINYTNLAYLFDEIYRHAYLEGNMTKPMTDFSFEIDDEGNPHWIITTYENEWLFSLPEATGILILDATTGDVEEYGLDEIPDWVDRVQPEEFIMNQINNQGEYIHGIFNFSNQDKFMSSLGEIIVYNNGNCYLFTGLTSVGADESAIGFIMVDMVTKESKIYQMSGATEYAAKLSAEGKVQQYEYYATFPIIINHNGIPTYFMTLKDNSGLIKQYSFVSVSDITSVGVGENISDALRDYDKALSSSNSFIEPEGELKEIYGNIVRIASENTGDTLAYKFIIDSIPNKIFTATYDVSTELALSKEGDPITISFYESELPIISVSDFDNTTFNQ